MNIKNKIKNANLNRFNESINANLSTPAIK